MNLITLPVTKLVPAPYNPRMELKPGDKGWERLERSVEEFGLVQPIVWNERTGHVVGGHQRLAVLKAKGADEVPAIVINLPLEREQALNIALNNPNVGGDWDAEKLVDLIGELQSLPEFDETLTGFNEQDLKDVLLGPDEFPEIEPDLKRDPGVAVRFSVATDQWEGFRYALDHLLKDWDIVPHVTM